jgi:hypothetical protein
MNGKRAVCKLLNLSKKRNRYRNCDENIALKTKKIYIVVKPKFNQLFQHNESTQISVRVCMQCQYDEKTKY